MSLRSLTFLISPRLLCFHRRTRRIGIRYFDSDLREGTCLHYLLVLVEFFLLLDEYDYPSLKTLDPIAAFINSLLAFKSNFRHC